MTGAVVPSGYERMPSIRHGLDVVGTSIHGSIIVLEDRLADPVAERSPVVVVSWQPVAAVAGCAVVVVGGGDGGDDGGVGSSCPDVPGAGIHVPAIMMCRGASESRRTQRGNKTTTQAGSQAACMQANKQAWRGKPLASQLLLLLAQPGTSTVQSCTH